MTDEVMLSVGFDEENVPAMTPSPNPNRKHVTNNDLKVFELGDTAPLKKQARKRKVCDGDSTEILSNALEKVISPVPGLKGDVDNDPPPIGRKRGRPPKSNSVRGRPRQNPVSEKATSDTEEKQSFADNDATNKAELSSIEQAGSPTAVPLSKVVLATPNLEINEEGMGTPGCTGRKRGRPPKATPNSGKKPGRPRKIIQEVTSPCSDEELSSKSITPQLISRSGRIIRTPVSCQASIALAKVDDNLNTPKSRRGRRKTCPNENDQAPVHEEKQNETTNAIPDAMENPSEETPAKRKKLTVKVKTIKNVVCGVCKKEMLEPNFIYHKYSVHHGLARLEGQSQEFTEQEKTQELRRTLDRLKKLHCRICSTAFTTLLGYQYHVRRCGKEASDLEEMLQECTVCGKKVMSLSAHMKTHEKRPEPKYEISNDREILSPDGKSKRAAALKAATILREIKDELAETQPKDNVKKASKYLIEPLSPKVSNSIIAAWKRQISSSTKSTCRYPSCEFSSDNIDRLKEHHVKCEVGANMQTYGCLKCSFRDKDRSSVVQHILKAHVTEAEFEPSELSSSEEEDDGSGDDENLEDEDESVEEKPKNKAIPHNSKFLDKAYGLPQNVLVQFKSLLNHNIIPKWLAQFHKKHFTWDSSLFTNWNPMQRVLNSPREYLPTTERSLPFARRDITNSETVAQSISYGRLERFQGTIQDCTPVFFSGGPVASAAWCPLPLVTAIESDGERDQFIAVSAVREEHQFRSSMISSFESKYVIQIWNCGKLPTLKPATTTPKLALCLAHEFGRIWCLRWCPSGCYDQERLGILAAACSDGTISCFSISNPSSIINKASEPVFLEAKPCVTLKLRTAEGSECTCLSWDETKGHRFVAGGFGNGTVAVWDLHAKSALLSKGDTLYPIWSFYAHASVLTAVSIGPHHEGARFLATASMDRTVKLWDKNDFSMPISWTKRSRITNIKWRRHWPGVTLCIDDFCALFRSSTSFYDFGYTGNRQGILPQNSVVWGAAENEYLDIVAHCTDAGEVVVYPSHFAVIESDEKKLRRQRKVVFRTDLIDTDSNLILNRMQKSYAQSTKKAITATKSENQSNSKKYALLFNESLNRSGKHFGTKQSHLKAVSGENMDILLPSDEPHTSINTIEFNPNFESHTWMCVCGENGLVHLLRVETHSAPRAATCYVEEINRD